MTAHRKSTHRADVVVSAQHGAGETLQHNAEPPGCDVEVTGLDPDTIRIGNPVTTVFQVDVGNEVFAASSIRLEAIGETVESSDWQMCPLV